MTACTELDQLPPYSRLAIYGAGRQGRNLVESLSIARPDVTVDVLLDDHRSIPDACPPVLHPEVATDILQAVDCILVPHRIASAVHPRLESLGKPVCILSPEMDFAHVFTREERTKHQVDEQEVCALIPDADATCFRHLMDCRTLGNSSRTAFRYPGGGTEYLDYIDRSRVKFMIDGGVANGQVEFRLTQELPALEMMHGFDPFPQLFERSPFRSKLADTNRFTFHPLGLWSTPETLYLHHNGHGSFLNHQALSTTDQAITASTIDTFVANHPVPSVDLIKLDVEGSEIEALKGANQTITNFRPYLAVCIYHDRADMYTIPRFLASAFSGYRFRLGHYSTGFNDTILYAIPD